MSLEFMEIRGASLEKEGPIRRDSRDRPYIWVTCDKCEGSGKVPSEKVAGRLNKCPKCKGAGRREITYTRMTTFIDCLDDKSNLSDWKQRKAAIGFARDPGLLEKFSSLPDPDGDDKSQAMALIKKAEERADADLKALEGTAVHDIIERINRGLGQGFVPDEYLADVIAYVEALKREGITVVRAEEFVVNDEYQAAGTFDILGIHRGVLKAMDLKTGRIDYGKAKIPMQLTGYATAQQYDPETGERSPITHTMDDGTVLEVDQSEGLIIHLPVGKGECSVVPCDLTAARDGLDLAKRVREFRRRSFQGEPLTTVVVDKDTLEAA